MTITLDLGLIARSRTVGERPPWVAGAFTEMYPGVVPSSVAVATVLATDEDWDAIAGHDQAVAAAIDHTITEEQTGAGWLVCKYAIDGTDFVVATTLDDTTRKHQPVSSVVLVATAATIQAHSRIEASG